MERPSDTTPIKKPRSDSIAPLLTPKRTPDIEFRPNLDVGPRHSKALDDVGGCAHCGNGHGAAISTVFYLYIF